MSTTEDDSHPSGAGRSAAELLGGEVREGYAEVGDQRLHYIEAGKGPLIVLLHGFPEFWYGWRLQIKPAPTLVIWGQRDRYLGEELADPEHDDVPNLDRVERLPNASHWVHHDEAERVTQLLTDFFAPAQPGKD